MTTKVKKMQHPDVCPFYDKATNTFSYVVKDPSSNYCAIIEGLWMDKYVVALYVEGSLVLAQSMCVLNVH